MSSAVTTFGVFKGLLKDSVNKNSSLDAATKSSMLVRVEDLPRDERVVLNFDNVASLSGQVTVDDLAKSIEVAIGVTGNNRVEWDLMTFAVPVSIAGTLTADGFLPGNIGASANPPVAAADISMEYRLSSTDAWKTFDRNTVLEEVSSIQFAATIADQVASAALPGLVLIAQQV